MQKKSYWFFQGFIFMSLTFIFLYAIFSIDVVRHQNWSNREYLFPIMIWCSCMGVCQIGYFIFLFFTKRIASRVEQIFTFCSIVLTAISVLFIILEYSLFRVWYVSLSETQAWNAALTYTLFSVIICLFIISFGFVLFFGFFPKKENANN